MRAPKEVLFIDTETTGLKPDQHKLLSIGLVVWKNGLILNPQEVLIWDEDDGKDVDPEAMGVNKIDLDNHRLLAGTPKEAVREIQSYMEKNLQTKGRVVLGGHNTGFDVGFIEKLMGYDLYDGLFMRRTVDTSVILRFLYHVGLLKSDIGSLENALRYFGFSDEALKGAHTAKVDALNTAKLYNKLLGRVADACRS